MEKIILPPTPEIERVCDLLEQLIHRFLLARRTVPSLGTYESETESLNLMYLIIRNVESITALAKKDLVLLPSAMNLTRTVFEMAMKTLWMLEPKDPFDRELRWLAQLQTEEGYFDRLSRRMKALGIDNRKVVEAKSYISDFRIGVTLKFPKPYQPLSNIPDLASMMKAIGEENKYATYIFLSQYSHGTHVATGLYRRGLGTKKEFGEYISPKDWEVIFSVSKYCLVKTGRKILEIINGDVTSFFTDDFLLEIESDIQKIKAS
jgi:hypothetical protein